MNFQQIKNLKGFMPDHEGMALFEWAKKLIGDNYECNFKSIPEPRNLNASSRNSDDSFHSLPKKLKDLLK